MDSFIYVLVAVLLPHFFTVVFFVIIDLITRLLYWKWRIGYKNYIQLDLNKIDFKVDNTNSRVWLNVWYKGEIDTQFTIISGKIGTVYIIQNEILFEDNLSITRNFDFNNIDQFSHPYIEPSENFLPFVTRPWMFLTDNTAANKSNIGDKVKEYYKLCNDESLTNQKEMKYDEFTHYKYAIVDHFIRFCAGVNENKFAQGSLGKGVGNEYIFAMNHLYDNKLIWSTEFLSLTELGTRSRGFGIQSAIASDREEKERKNAIRRSIATLIFSAILIAIALYHNNQ